MDDNYHLGPKANLMTSQSQQYGNRFYDLHFQNSYRSGKEFARLVSQVINPKRVVDLGCGRGAWLKAFRDLGASTLVGLDGPWNNQGQMPDQDIHFVPADLDSLKPSDNHKYDLAVSVEVAEHLRPESSEQFVRSIASMADVIIFGAAYEGQGGVNHFNERRHSYWAQLFKSYGFVPYDFFRPQVWGSCDVDFWYQQNTFLYVKGGSPVNESLSNIGFSPMHNLEFMNCVHPQLFSLARSRNKSQPYKLLRILRRAIANVLGK